MVEISKGLSTQTAFLLNVCSGRASDILRQCLEKFDLSYGTYFTLCLLSESPSLSQKEIAECLFINVNTVTRIVDELEARGLAKRTQNKDNRKEKRPMITDAGMELFKRASATLNNLRKKGYPLTQAEREQLRRLLLKIIQAPEPDVEG